MPGGHIRASTIRSGAGGHAHERFDVAAKLYPCHVLLFGAAACPTATAPRRLLAEAKAAAVWSVRLDDRHADGGERARIITVPARYAQGVQYVRVQLEDNDAARLAREAAGLGKHAALSFAELELFATRASSLEGFDGGRVVAARPVTAPYQPEDALTELFSPTPMAGEWTLTVSDAAAYTYARHADGRVDETHGRGVVGDWVLLLTDQSGYTVAHYMDVSATVETLPRYGEVHVAEGDDKYGRPAASTTPWPAAGWAQFYESATEYVPLPTRHGFHRLLAECYGVDTTGLRGVAETRHYRYCWKRRRRRPAPTRQGRGGAAAAAVAGGAGLGDAPVGAGAAGAVAAPNLLRGARVLEYHPAADFLGVDSFTYSIRVGNRWGRAATDRDVTHAHAHTDALAGAATTRNNDAGGVGGAANAELIKGMRADYLDAARASPAALSAEYPTVTARAAVSVHVRDRRPHRRARRDGPAGRREQARGGHLRVRADRGVFGDGRLRGRADVTCASAAAVGFVPLCASCGAAAHRVHAGSESRA